MKIYTIMLNESWRLKMDKKIKNGCLLLGLIFIFAVISIYIYISKQNNINRLINKNWEISLPDCESFEILKREFEEFLFEGEVIINMKYAQSDIDELLKEFEWITEEKVIKENIQKCNEILKISNTFLNKLELSIGNNKFFFKFRKSEYLILVFNPDDNNLMIIMESY